MGILQGKPDRKSSLAILQKNLLGVKQSTQNNFVYGDLGRRNYQSCRYVNIVKYWLKVITKPDNKLVNILYKQMKNDFETNHTTINWAVLVRKLLCELGFYEVWLQQGVGNVNIFLSIFKQRVGDHFQQVLNNELSNSSRAVFYRSISHSFPGLSQNYHSKEISNSAFKT